MNKGYSVAVILTVALGIGANAAMFTIINAVLLRPLPYANPERLVSTSIKNKDGDMGVVPERIFFEWQRSAKSVAVSTATSIEAVFAFESESEQIRGVLASASYFDVLGTRPKLGRLFAPAEDVPGQPDVIVLSDQLWRRRFAGDPGVIGRTIDVDGKPTTVIGIMPAAYSTTRASQFWMPYRVTASSPGTSFYYYATGRLRPGYSIAAARAELSTLTARAARDDEKNVAPVLMTLHQRRYGEAQKPLVLLFAAVGVLLLIACANLANLSLARAARREREFVVRLALGASRWRVMRHVLSESLMLAGVGAALGLTLSIGAVAYFVRMSPGSVANVERIHVDGTVLAFTFVAAVATGLLFGLVPANAAGRGDFGRVLSSGSSRLAGSRRQQWLRRFLVVGQLATALMLLTGAGIVARTFWRVTSLDLGFSTERILTAEVSLPRARYKPGAIEPFFNELLALVRREPGVEIAALTGALPLGGIMGSVRTTDSAGHQSPLLDKVAIGPAYLETIGAHIMSGRSIAESDGNAAPKVAVINETAARALFPDGSAVGRTLPYQRRTVVGIVKDIRQRQLEHPMTPVIYMPIAQSEMWSGMVVTLRTTGDPEALEDRIRRAVSAIDGALAPPAFETMEARAASAVAPRRFTFLLLGTFAVLAAALAIVGLYGVLSFVVAERTREIGIRVALGADAARVRRLVIAQGMALTVVGVMIGVGGSALGARTLRSVVFQTSVYDTRAFVGSAAMLIAIAFLACYVPARRASRVDPILALRAE